MDLRHLRYFVAVAKTLHFGRAARQLNMSQPPLSKRIAELEAALGVLLFDRGGRRVALTRAGEALLPKAQAAIDAFADALRAVRDTVPAHARRLRIAFPPDTSRRVLVALVEAFRAHELEASIAEATTAEQHGLLAAGEIDVGVLRYPYDARGLKSTRPLRQMLGAIVAKAHPLAAQEQVALRDLAPFALVMFPRAVAPELYDELLSACRKGGYRPAHVEHALRMTAGLLLARSAVTFGAALAPSSPGLVGADPDLVWKPIRGEPLSWRTSVAWRAVDRRAVTQFAANQIQQLLVQHDGWEIAPAMRRARAPVPGAAVRR